MICIFDTSAVNALQNDKEQHALVKGFLAANQIRVTALNAVEIFKNADQGRRRDLCQMLCVLANYERPFAEPNDYLGKFALAYCRKDPNLELLVPNEAPLCEAMRDPDSLSADEIAEAIRWSKENEDRLLAANTDTRPLNQEDFEKGTVRPRTASVWIKEFLANQESVASMLLPLYEHYTSEKLPTAEIGPFLQWSPEWRLYLCCWVYSNYMQAVQLENFGRRRNAGMMDLMCAIYLPRCDVFVTHDRAQRRALRVLARLSPNQPRVRSYSEFRRGLLVL